MFHGLVLGATLALFPFTVLSQSSPGSIFCDGTQLLTSNQSGPASPFYLGHNVKLTHFGARGSMIPRLITKKNRNGLNPRGSALIIKEGGPDGSLGTQDDFETELHTPTLDRMIEPSLGDFEVYGQYLIFSVQDYGTPQSSPVHVILVELQEGGQPKLNGIFPNGEQIVASYSFVHTPNFISDPRVMDVQIDQYGDPRNHIPIVSWVHSFNQRHIQNGDDIYYCRFDQCGAPSAAQINQTMWAEMGTHSVSEMIGSGLTFLTTAHVSLNYNNTYDSGIYAKEPSQSPVTFPWLDQTGVNPNQIPTAIPEKLADNYGPLIFYYTADSTGGPSKLNLAYYPLTPQQSNPPIFSHQSNLPGFDAHLQVSKIVGYSLNQYFAQPRQSPGEIFYFWDRVGQSINVGNGFKVPRSTTLISSLSHNTPVHLDQLIQLPPGHFTYARAVSRNLFVVSTLPDPNIYDPSLLQYYKNSNDELISFIFYCSY